MKPLAKKEQTGTGIADIETEAMPAHRSRRSERYIALAVMEFFLGGGMFALVPLFFAFVYKARAVDDPGTNIRWVTLTLLLSVFLYGVFCNLYVIASFLASVQ